MARPPRPHLFHRPRLASSCSASAPPPPPRRFPHGAAQTHRPAPPHAPPLAACHLPSRDHWPLPTPVSTTIAPTPSPLPRLRCETSARPAPSPPRPHTVAIGHPPPPSCGHWPVRTSITDAPPPTSSHAALRSLRLPRPIVAPPLLPPVAIGPSPPAFPETVVRLHVRHSTTAPAASRRASETHQQPCPLPPQLLGPRPPPPLRLWPPLPIFPEPLDRPHVDHGPLSPPCSPRASRPLPRRSPIRNLELQVVCIRPLPSADGAGWWRSPS